MPLPERRSAGPAGPAGPAGRGLVRLMKAATKEGLNLFGYEIRRQSSVWNSVISQALRALLRFEDVRVVFDVGAFEGDTAEAFLGWFPHAQVHAFEPLETTYERLARRFVGHGRVSTSKCAICENDEKVELFVTSSPQSNSLLHPLQTGRANGFQPCDSRQDHGPGTVPQLLLRRERNRPD